MAFGQAAEPAPARGPTKDGVAPAFRHEIWGGTYYGDGYVYGPTSWRSSMAVVDIDNDGDNDFAFRANYNVPPQVMRNLGARGAFYPGGLKDLNIPDPEPGEVYLDVVMDFEDITGDGRPDLVALANRFAPRYETYLAWYRNDGPLEGDPRDEPQFTFMGYAYTSPQDNLPEMSLNLADIDNDGLVDLFAIEPFLGTAPYPHRVFLIKNTGSPSMPKWGDAVEVDALTQLLPKGIVEKRSAPAPDSGLYAPDLLRMRLREKQAIQAGVRVSDIEICDWDVDGRLDFLFYDALQGVDWVRNIGTDTAPVWNNELNVILRAPWRHNDLPAYGIPGDEFESLDRAFGTFAVRSNPRALLPEPRWLDDFYVNMEGLLVTRRYFEGADEGYRVTQKNCLEYPTGQGAAAFWDYDGDGDLDMFRSGVGAGAHSYMLLFPNIGTSYAPAWGRYQILQDVLLCKGSEENLYRQDLYVFADVTGFGAADLFVQTQNGAIARYLALQGDPPAFTLLNAEVVDLGHYALDGVQPRGFAFADFNDSRDGVLEVVVALGSTDGGRLFYVKQDMLSGPGALLWDAPVDMSTWLDDEFAEELSPNRIESIASADLDHDGRFDLLLSLSEDFLAGDDLYYTCSQHWYRNTYDAERNTFSFEYAGKLDAPYQEDWRGSRIVSVADIDADGDADLFIGHQVYDPYQGIGPRYHLRFYRNSADTDLHFVRTRVVAGQTWPLHIGGVAPEYRWVTNASGGWLGLNADYTAGD
ncbi:MAG TPA: VCBS repeat-containing protein, partial [Candidatus Hydrogenedentes bacterium]|nr:VCBS repeat-containing protein [Candidatus Hydrogenedentota bacterium]